MIFAETCLRPRLDLIEQVSQSPDVELNVIYRSPEVELKTRITGIVADLGTSNCKYGAVDETGQIMGMWSVPTKETFLPGGFVRLEDYSFQTLAGLKSVFKLNFDFSDLRFIAVVGIYPSLVVANSGASLFDRYGLTYATSMGARKAEELARVDFYPKRRQVPPGPSYAYETMADLLEAKVLPSSPDLLCVGLPDYVLSSLASREGLTKTSFNALQYMGVLTSDGKSLIPRGLSDRNFLSPNSPEQLSVATADLNVLKRIGLKELLSHPVVLLNRGTDGPLIHEIEIDGTYPARAKYESTVACSVRSNRSPDLRLDNEAWVLIYGPDDFRFGLAANCGVTTIREFTFNKGFRIVLSDDRVLTDYEEFFEMKEGEKENEYFNRLDSRLLQWLQRNGISNHRLGDIGIFVTGPSRNNKGPKEAGVYEGKTPSSPELFYYLLKEETVFAMKYAVESLEKLNDEKIEWMVAVGPILKSPVWQQIHFMAIEVPLGEILSNNQSLKEPSLVALALVSLEELGLKDKAETLQRRLSSRVLPTLKPQFPYDKRTVDRRYRKYLQLFERKPHR